MDLSGQSEFDVAFVGGGLASVLAALMLLERRPSLRIALVERDRRLGGNHTWCFHAADLPRDAARVVAPMVVQRWDGYQVHFPARSRRLSSPYACITSERLDRVATARLRASPHCRLFMGRVAVQVDAKQVVLDDDRVLHAQLVIAATGPEPGQGARGYQKFVGLELEAPSHGIREPVLFDACIPQHDGFRFMYLLPLAPDRLLVEETFFSDTANLDEQRSHREIRRYCAARGISAGNVVRSERGVLPMPWVDREFAPHARPLSAGYRAGLFHPVTGYSFPLAVRFALALAESDLAQLVAEPERASPLSAFADQVAASRPFLHLLTRLLFEFFEPAQRYHVLEHFYRLPAPLIERFYASTLSPLDRARIFLGAPPRGFSVGRAWRAQREAS